MENRIKQLREARGWSMRKLAEKVSTSASTINKLEKGETTLNVHWMERLARIFDVSAAELLGSASDKVGFQEDVIPHERGQDEPKLALTETQLLYQVTTKALDQLGIMPGALLVVETSKASLTAIENGDPVIAQLTSDRDAITLLRQYIAPSLLITNSSEDNAPIINLRNEDAGIQGIVVAAHNFFHQNKTSA
jgi:transcriptional regulator with XRE-family HTH domain